MILDTSALSAAADGDPAAVRLLARGGPLAIPVVVLGEYRHGIRQSRHHTTYKSWLTELLSDCLVFDVSEPTTQHYPDIAGELKRKCMPIPTNDI